ncbi:MAG: glycosyltransferase family 2 protein [Zestosphaera sp.]
MRVLVVLLNKDNARGLKNALESLSKQSGVSICVDFDVLVVDGWSTDNSEQVAEEFKSRFKCINFIKQRFKGGVGQARVEAVKYGMDLGYDLIIWGDSENEYSENYVSSFLKCFNSEKSCDVCSGSTYVRDSFWGMLFYWYHTYHHLFKFVSRRHAPGNNKAVKTSLYKKHTYPAISRSDDFFFSLSLHGNAEFCYCEEASLVTTVPKSLKEVIAWQRNRVKGLVEGSLLTGKKLPPDFTPWFLFMLSPLMVLIAYLAIMSAGLASLTSVPAEVVFLACLAGLTYLIIKLELLARERYLRYRPLQGFLGLLGMYLHSIFTVYYTLKFAKTLKHHLNEIKERDKQVKEYFGFTA